MRTSTWIMQTDHKIRSLTPFMITLLMVLISALPWQIPNFAPVTPAFTAISIYYWSIYQNIKLPYYSIFGLGMLLDLLTGIPLGLSALIYLLVKAILNSQRNFFTGKPFWIVWAGFAVVMLGISVFGWIVSSLYFSNFVAPLPFLIQCVLTILLYPVISFLLSILNRNMLKSP